MRSYYLKGKHSIRVNDQQVGIQADYDLYWAGMKSRKTISTIKPRQTKRAA